MGPGFDFGLTMLNYTQERLQEFINVIKKSDLSKLEKSDLIHLLETVAVQVKQARSIGWLP